MKMSDKTHAKSEGCRRQPLRQMSAAVLILSAIVMLAGCEGSKSDAANNHGSSDPNHPELFTIPQNQMSHVQVVSVQPTTLTRMLRLTGAVAYNNFRTTPHNYPG